MCLKKIHLYSSYSNTKHEVEQDFTRFKSFIYQIFSELLLCGRFQEAPGTGAPLCELYTLVGTVVLGRGGQRWSTSEINKANSIRRTNEPAFKGSRDSRLQKPMFFFIISKENVLAENLQNSHCGIKEGKNIKNKTLGKKTHKKHFRWLEKWLQSRWRPVSFLILKQISKGGAVQRPRGSNCRAPPLKRFPLVLASSATSARLTRQTSPLYRGVCCPLAFFKGLPWWLRW